jgi:hypothetical protein
MAEIIIQHAHPAPAHHVDDGVLNLLLLVRYDRIHRFPRRLHRLCEKLQDGWPAEIVVHTRTGPVADSKHPQLRTITHAVRTAALKRRGWSGHGVDGVRRGDPDHGHTGCHNEGWVVFTRYPIAFRARPGPSPRPCCEKPGWLMSPPPPHLTKARAGCCPTAALWTHARAWMVYACSKAT